MALDPSFIIQNLQGAKAPKGNARDPFPLLGNHVFAVVNIFMKPTKKFGPAVAVDLHCAKSDNAAMVVGSKYQTLFRVSMNSPNGFEQEEEYARMMTFMNACTGHALNDAAQSATTAQRFLAPQNAGRGFLVGCRGWTNGKSDFVNYEWSTVPGQTLEQIKALREKLDAKYPSVVAQAAQHVAPQPTAPAAAPAAAPSGALDLNSLGL